MSDDRFTFDVSGTARYGNLIRCWVCNRPHDDIRLVDITDQATRSMCPEHAARWVVALGGAER